MFLQKISGPAIRLGSLEIWADKLGAKKKEENNKKKKLCVALITAPKVCRFPQDEISPSVTGGQLAQYPFWKTYRQQGLFGFTNMDR